MKKLLSLGMLPLLGAFLLTGKVTAQGPRYGTGVCVNASLADEAKRRFPNATLHVFPDLAIRGMNGWRIVRGPVALDGRIHTDADEIRIRRERALLLLIIPYAAAQSREPR